MTGDEWADVRCTKCNAPLLDEDVALVIGDDVLCITCLDQRAEA